MLVPMRLRGDERWRRSSPENTLERRYDVKALRRQLPIPYFKRPRAHNDLPGLIKRVAFEFHSPNYNFLKILAADLCSSSLGIAHSRLRNQRHELQCREARRFGRIVSEAEHDADRRRDCGRFLRERWTNQLPECASGRTRLVPWTRLPRRPVNPGLRDLDALDCLRAGGA